MTGRELIAHLQSLPEDALDFEVIYQCCSDYSRLTAGQITVVRETDDLEYGMPIHHHNMPGEYRRYTSMWEYGKGTVSLPKPANTIVFPGN